MSPIFKPRFSFFHLFGLLLLLVPLTYLLTRPPPDFPSRSVRHSGNFKLTNPLVECEPDSHQIIPLTPLKKEINSLIGRLTKDYSVDLISIYFRNLNNGPWIGINQDELFSPASLIKVPIMIAYFKMAESDPNILTQKITYTPTPQIENPNILPQATLTPNQAYTINELIERMIVYSDNQAFAVLTQHLGQDKIAATFRDLDVDLTQTYLKPFGNNLSVQQYASFFRILYNSAYLSPTMSEKALDILSRVEFTQGIRAPVPAKYVVSHKFGERSYEETGEKQLHDCGIIYFPRQPYLLCIMTRGTTDFPNLQKSIQAISQAFFNYFESQATPSLLN